jgi:hypothetical protein
VLIFANSLFDTRLSQLDWYSSKRLDALEIPKVSRRPFQIVQHLGVIVVPSEVFFDESRVLIDKLAEGTVYHHKGLYSLLSVSGPGRKLSKDALKVIRALEHVGTTNMCISEMNRMCKSIFAFFLGNFL